MSGKVSKEVARERETRAWELRVQKNKTHQAIADELGVTQQAVTAMLHRVAKRYLDKSEQFVAIAKASQTEQLLHIVDEALGAWEQSKRDVVTTITVIGKVEVLKDGTVVELPEETKIEREGQIGDPRFLEQLRGALADIRKIWGADAPKKTEVSGDENKPVVIRTVTAEIPSGIVPDEPDEDDTEDAEAEDV